MQIGYGIRLFMLKVGVTIVIRRLFNSVIILNVMQTLSILGFNNAK